MDDCDQQPFKVRHNRKNDTTRVLFQKTLSRKNAIESPKSSQITANFLQENKVKNKMKIILENTLQLRSAFQCVSFKRDLDHIKKAPSFQQNISREHLDQLQVKSWMYSG